MDCLISSSILTSPTRLDYFKPRHNHATVWKDELSIQHGCILWGVRVIVPPPGRSIVLDQLHEAHPGITRMKQLARSFVWWPRTRSGHHEKSRTVHII